MMQFRQDFGSLKVLSSEMDLAEIRFVRKSFIKERGSEVFRKIRPSPILCETLKATPHLIQLLAFWKQIANGAHSSVRGLLFTSYSCWQRCYEQICFQWCNVHYKPRMLLFSVGNGRMNPPQN
jgi:hypothetical protein